MLLTGKKLLFESILNLAIAIAMNMYISLVSLSHYSWFLDVHVKFYKVKNITELKLRVNKWSHIHLVLHIMLNDVRFHLASLCDISQNWFKKIKGYKASSVVVVVVDIKTSITTTVLAFSFPSLHGVWITFSLKIFFLPKYE